MFDDKQEIEISTTPTTNKIFQKTEEDQPSQPAKQASEPKTSLREDQPSQPAKQISEARTSVGKEDEPSRRQSRVETVSSKVIQQIPENMAEKTIKEDNENKNNVIKPLELRDESLLDNFIETFRKLFTKKIFCK